VCVFDRNLISRFHLLGDDTHGEIATPPVFIAFDVLHTRGRDLRGRPLRERRDALEDLVAGADRVFPSLRLGASERVGV
jgi:ATP-dependent DNA ligase